jgi:hypothetical protein
LRSRVFRSLDAVVTAGLEPPASPGGETQRSTSNYERVESLVRRGCRLVPGLLPRLRQLLERSDRLPLGQELHLLARGTGSTVYAVGAPPASVLKIYRRSLGCSPNELLAIARMFQSKRDHVRSWYPGLESVFPPTLHLVLDGVLLGRPAAAALQTFIDGRKHDLFGLPAAELNRWMNADARFRTVVQRFAASTLATYERDGHVLDLVGSGNVIVSEKAGVHQLHIVDYGIFERSAIAKRAASLIPQLEWRLRRLEQLAADGDALATAP